MSWKVTHITDWPAAFTDGATVRMLPYVWSSVPEEQRGAAMCALVSDPAPLRMETAARVLSHASPAELPKLVAGLDYAALAATGALSDAARTAFANDLATKSADVAELFAAFDAVPRTPFREVCERAAISRSALEAVVLGGQTLRLSPVSDEEKAVAAMITRAAGGDDGFEIGKRIGAPDYGIPLLATADRDFEVNLGEGTWVITREKLSKMVRMSRDQAIEEMMGSDPSRHHEAALVYDILNNVSPRTLYGALRDGHISG